MHGIIHVGIKSFVEARHGIDVWPAILEKAGLGQKTYLKDKIYPDKEAVAIIMAASELTGTPPEDIMEDFGKFLMPLLITLYNNLIQPGWKAMDMLMHTESNIHNIVRKELPEATPPKLRFEKLGEKEIKLHYNSPRCMSAVAKGLIKGVADYYGEKIALNEEKKPDGHSEILITFL